MLQIPAHTQPRYKALLVKKAIPERYHFIKKLREKNQTEQPHKRASDEISISYGTGVTHSGEKIPFFSTGQKIRQDKQDEQDYFIFHHGKSLIYNTLDNTILMC